MHVSQEVTFPGAVDQATVVGGNMHGGDGASLSLDASGRSSHLVVPKTYASFGRWAPVGEIAHHSSSYGPSHHGTSISAKARAIAILVQQMRRGPVGKGVFAITDDGAPYHNPTGMHMSSRGFLAAVVRQNWFEVYGQDLANPVPSDSRGGGSSMPGYSTGCYSFGEAGAASHGFSGGRPDDQSVSRGASSIAGSMLGRLQVNSQSNNTVRSGTGTWL